ncbi:MAG: 2-oxo acid dehydrogenase subunit E2 [Sinobacteraceae bacterium]|nr:2-oxo acid dehydrogenase subunit E2 [Nevskiaceae bacterium]
MTSKISAVVVPKWGLEMTEGTISSWLKMQGNAVDRGEPLLEVESEKIVNSVDAPADGVLRRILIDAGNAGAVGTLVGIVADTDVSEQDIDAFIAGFRSPVIDDKVAPSTEVPAAVETRVNTVVDSEPPGNSPVRISPPVRRLAESLGVSLASLRGTGPNGRILQQDVERAAAGSATISAASPTPEISGGVEQPRLQPWSATRRAIAKKMVDSARGVPHFYIVMDVDARPLQTLRERYKAAGTSASINDLIVQATARVLPRHPAVNANHADDGLLSFAHAHIAVAVATDEGVLAPVLRFADRLQLPELTVALAGLRERVTARRVGKGELDGASFTVSNLGMYGVREFTSIITAPQCASLAVGAIRSSGDAMTLTLTLSCDHRAIDGATGAAFLRELKDALETA